MTEAQQQVLHRARALAAAEESLMDQLVALRKAHKLSQADVAERLGISQPAVAAFERYDSNPTLSTLRRYALAIEARLSFEVIDDHVLPASTPHARSNWVAETRTIRNASTSGAWKSQGTRRARLANT